MKLLICILVKIIAFFIVATKLPGILLRKYRYRTNGATEKNIFTKFTPLTWKFLNSPYVDEMKLEAMAYEISRMLPSKYYINYKIVLNGNERYYMVEVFTSGKPELCEIIVVKDIQIGYKALSNYFVKNEGKSPMDNYRLLTNNRSETPVIT